jgi:hypothetical protein
MKSLLLSLSLVLVCVANAQTKVVTEVKETEYLELQTLKYEVYYRSDNTKYYTYTFISGYEYPNIQEGYYSYGIFAKLSDLITFYSELSNLENQEDGLYKLSLVISGSGNIYADKLSEEITLYSTYKIMKYKTFTMSDIKTDLALLKSMLKR